MQITLIRHGHYDSSSGHLTREGIEEGIGAGVALGNAVDPKITDFLDNETGLNGGVPVAEHPIKAPDLILTSPALRAKETGFVVSEQLKQLGINSELKYNIAYLNDLDLFTDGYRPNHHGHMTQEMAEKLYPTEPIQKTVDFIRRLAKEGKEHVILISHQPNIHVLLRLLGCKSLYELSGHKYYAPQHGVTHTLLSVDPEKIGEEKYQIQIRNAKPVIRNAYDTSFKTIGLPILPVDYIEWHMPDFVYMDSKLINARKRSAKALE